MNYLMSDGSVGWLFTIDINSKKISGVFEYGGTRNGRVSCSTNDIVLTIASRTEICK